MTTTSIKDSIPSARRIPNSQFASRIQPPSTLPLRTTSKLRQPQVTRNSSAQSDQQLELGKETTSHTLPPRVSFLTPREVWSPLSNPIPGMNESRNNARVTAGTSKVPKYQLKDTGPIPLSNTKAPSSSLPRPQTRNKHPVSRPSIKAHRQPSIQRPLIQIPRPQLRQLPSNHTSQQSSHLPVPFNYTRSRPVSLPADPASPLSIPKTRPASFQPPSSIPPTIAIPQSRPRSLLPVPTILTSVPPSREASNHSIASSACSTASSLARHRAIKGRGKDRSSFARLSSYSPPDHEALLNAVSNDSEEDDTESTISDHSIRTVATVNPIEHNSTSPRAASLIEIKNTYEQLYVYEQQSKHHFIPYPVPQEGLTAPYLVPSTAPPMTLEWESDESSGEIDEAEKVWRELEVKLGRKVRGRSLRRGRWIVKPREGGGEMTNTSSIKEAIDEEINNESVDMEPTSSGFSVSLYYSPRPDHLTPALDTHPNHRSCTYESPSILHSPSEATALFDMSAPLVPSGSKHGSTPWNTPMMNKQSIKRGNRVKKKFASVDVQDVILEGRLGILEEDDRVEFPQVDAYLPNTQPMSPEQYIPSPPSQQSSPRYSFQNRMEPPHQNETSKPSSPSMNVPMYRLDSHIISALSALQGSYDSPELDFALSSSPTLSPISMSSDEEEDEGEDDTLDVGGLGLGMKIHLKTVYHMPTLSPRLRPSAAQKSMLVEKCNTKIQNPTSGPNVGKEISDVPTVTETISESIVTASETSNMNSADEDMTTAEVKKILVRVEENKVPEASSLDEEVLVIRDLDTGVERQIRIGDGFLLA